MTLITDPSDLNQADPSDASAPYEIVVDTTTKTISLRIAGNLSNDGVTGQALYSFLKDEWKTDASLIPYPFPMLSITPEQFEFVGGWRPSNTDSNLTRNLLRSAGWREISAANATNRQYMNVISLGAISSSDRAYYAFASDTAKTDFDFDGPVNQAVQVFGDSTNGNFDKRSQELTIFIRIQGKKYGLSTTSSIGLTALNYIANRFPLAESVNLKITNNDTAISTTSPYTGMSITYQSATYEIDTVGTNRSFDVTVNGNGGTLEQINEFVAYKLRQATDIDSLSSGKYGFLSSELMDFLGNDLKTRKGVFVSNFNVDDTNRITFTDTGNVERTFPFVASGILNFNQNLEDDADATYHLFFADTFGSTSATKVKDNNNADISGTIGEVSSKAFTFDFDNNIQQGRTPGTPAPVIAVAIGLTSAQYVSATATITRSAGQTISLVAPLERNYSNPA